MRPRLGRARQRRECSCVFYRYELSSLEIDYRARTGSGQMPKHKARVTFQVNRVRCFGLKRSVRFWILHWNFIGWVIRQQALKLPDSDDARMARLPVHMPSSYRVRAPKPQKSVEGVEVVRFGPDGATDRNEPLLNGITKEPKVGCASAFENSMYVTPRSRIQRNHPALQGFRIVVQSTLYERTRHHAHPRYASQYRRVKQEVRSTYLYLKVTEIMHGSKAYSTPSNS